VNYWHAYHLTVLRKDNLNHATLAYVALQVALTLVDQESPVNLTPVALGMVVSKEN